ncbi:hypothetical protein MPTK1_2g16610 [Marchantia polymorpha subsp. ruderalis]|uniref:Uncharacterized protein n=2 Tax=Marchantia polymorpha TaxID=3197 RepID=A0A176W8D4_MARPO|nr:hypothetical protein AXG93_2865s1060 [Marchantia polymorpha subsp. ruderalis]PTQ30558.1 hypothetical protein MARPO_0122s0002 [Marchantia polymorpha]BBN02610.1 hypothetical protein Mp_2g16610 [Marchantia polymorpha subsp. ruderalis]|eukprot:PTQ30558.1 hypothetical protein MARPO_0122s0002 [Marchantia polymorpha]
MAPGHLIVLLAFFLVCSSATVCMGEKWPSQASSSLSHQTTSAESERTFIQSSRKGQLLYDELLRAVEFKERDLDHHDHRGLQLHASKIHHSGEGLFHEHETDPTPHRFSRAVSLLEVSFGEADALLAFKDGLGNYLEGALDVWTPDKRSEYCSWTRVTCNRQLHVTALHLSSLDLIGSLGSSLCNLTYLEELHLDRNFLQSEIPPELGRLSRLRILNLQENQLYGSIPKELGNLTSLQVLNLASQGSWFNGTIPEELGQLSQLRFLNLGVVNNTWEKYYYFTGTNELRGTIPRSLGNCTKLWYLDFYGNSHLTGVIPEELGKLIHLKFLSFMGNNFTGAVPHQLRNLTMCEHLGFRKNSLQGHLPVGFANLSRLVSLDVGNNFFTGNLVQVSSTSWSELSVFFADDNAFTGKFPELLLSCRNLVTLDLSSNNFSGNLPADLGRLSSAKSIIINDNMFGGELPESLTNISLLTSLDLSGNKFTGPLDALGNSTLLKILSLRSSGFVKNRFTGSLTDAIVRSWLKMRFLDLSYNAMSGKIPGALGNLTQLTGLFLSGNKFNGVIPKEFGDQQKLIYLALSYNELTGKIPASLANLQDVIEMDLGNNKLTGSIPRQLGNLTNIWLLALSSNHLTGEIPPDLGKLQNLKVLYLRNNNLTGSIPVTLNNCSYLVRMRLSYNSLTGKLTHINFAELEYLTIFSVSGNQLSGLFPVTLWNCSDLYWLDLSKNHLSGMLPNFDVLNTQWYEPRSQGLFLSGLKVLSLAFNYFSGSIPSSIWSLPALQVLDLSSNALTGVLPQDLSGLETYKLPLKSKLESANNFLDLRSMEEISLRRGESTLGYTYVLRALALLDLSDNQLTGELPMELGTLHGLTYLFMADNNFNGSIPAELGEIVDLTELDLSENELSGPIPVSLSKLRLGYLNLSLNQLCGPIPVADSFDTRFSGSFLPGNPKLCGDTINKPCESSAFSCGSDLDPHLVTKPADSWSLYFHGVSMTAFAIGASVGFATVIGMITLIPSLRNRFLFAEHPKMERTQFDYGLFVRPS